MRWRIGVAETYYKLKEISWTTWEIDNSLIRTIAQNHNKFIFNYVIVF